MAGDPYFAPPKTRPYTQEVSMDPGRLRIAFWERGLAGEPLHEEAVAAVRGAAKLCSELGHEVEEAAPTFDYNELLSGFVSVYSAGLASTIETVKQVTGVQPTLETLESLTLNFYEIGRQISAAQYLMAVTTLQRFSRMIAPFFETYDVWLTPTLGCPPLKVGTIDFQSPSASLLDQWIMTFTHVNPAYNITGQPAISLPLHWTAEGLPLGVLFGGKYGDEATLFRLAGQIELARPWKDRHPAIWG